MSSKSAKRAKTDKMDERGPTMEDMRIKLAAFEQREQQLIDQAEQREKELNELIKQAEQREKELIQQVKQAEQREKEEKELRIKAEQRKNIWERISVATFVTHPRDIQLVSSVPASSHTGSNSHVQGSHAKHPLVLENLDPEDGSWKDSGAWHFPSAFLLKISNKNPADLVYATEADVSSYVTPVLEDALRLVTARTGKKPLTLHHEASLFSNRPDHLVVTNDMGNCVLVVEDKKPLPQNSDLSDCPNVLGQVFDDIMAMKLFGNSAPFVVLSTFNKNWLCWHDEGDSTKLVTSAQSRKVCFKEILPGSPSKDSQDVCGAKDTPSPPSLILDSPTSQRPADPLGFHTEASVPAKRKVCISKSYSSKELVQLFYTATLCGLAKNPSVKRKQLKRYKRYFSGQVLKLTNNEKGYTWGKLSLDLLNQEPLSSSSRPTRRQSSPGTTKKYYYIFGLVSRGATSKAFLAFDQNHRECVIKMHVKQDYEDGGGDILSKQKQLEIATQKCKKEIGNFKNIYSGCSLVDKVSFANLNGFPCVIMPFFEPVPKNTREENMPKIWKCLKLFADKKLKYCDDDVRWRHVGTYENKIVLFDLADLEECTSDPANLIQQHYDILSRRMDSECQATIPEIST